MSRNAWRSVLPEPLVRDFANVARAPAAVVANPVSVLMTPAGRGLPSHVLAFNIELSGFGFVANRISCSSLSAPTKCCSELSSKICGKADLKSRHLVSQRLDLLLEVIAH